MNLLSKKVKVYPLHSKMLELNQVIYYMQNTTRLLKAKMYELASFVQSKINERKFEEDLLKSAFLSFCKEFTKDYNYGLEDWTDYPLKKGINRLSGKHIKVHFDDKHSFRPVIKKDVSKLFTSQESFEAFKELEKIIFTDGTLI